MSSIRRLVRKFLVAAVQNLFFFGVKVRPKADWVQEFEQLGEIQRIPIARDGGSLCCLKITKAGQPGNGKTVILAHPISRKAKYFFLEGTRIGAYRRLGYDVVVFDFNGFGESDRIDCYYWRDAQAVIAYFAADARAEHLIIHGLSFGSFHIIRALAALPPNSSVVLENTSRSLFDYWKRWFITRNAVRLLEALHLRPVREMNVQQVLAELDRPDLKFLFVGCEHDEYTPFDEMRDLGSHLKGNKEMVLIAGANHLEAPVADSIKYFEALSRIASA